MLPDRCISSLANQANLQVEFEEMYGNQFHVQVVMCFTEYGG